jgi:hypothetical protein
MSRGLNRASDHAASHAAFPLPPSQWLRREDRDREDNEERERRLAEVSHVCFQFKNVSIVKFMVLYLFQEKKKLLEAQALSILELAVSDEYAEEILNILEQSPSTIDSRDSEGRSALHLACLYGSIDVVEVLRQF